MLGFAGTALVLSLHLFPTTAALPASPSESSDARTFERWIMERQQELESDQAPGFCGKLIERFDQDRRVTSTAVLTCVNAYRAYEENILASKPPTASAANAYALTHQFIQQVLKRIEDRPFLMAQVLSIQGMIHNTGDSLENAIQSWTRSAELLNQHRMEVDKERISTLNHLADALHAAGESRKAEEHYLEVLSYPWYTLVQNPEAVQFFRSQYIRAGYGLIDTRRGNLDALREIQFVPATQHELNPYLKNAIREAQ